MNRFTKALLTGIIAVCTLPFAACTSGNLPIKETPTKAESSSEDSVLPTPTAGTEQTYPKSTAFDKVPDAAQKWIDKAKEPLSVIMTNDEIQSLNKQMREKCNALTDIENYPGTMKAIDVKSLIEESSGPSLPKYDTNGKAISQSMLYEIKNNRNLNALSGDIIVKRGVTVKRTDIRALPTAIEFYNNANKQDHDRMQESELSSASAVIVLHTSTDGKFYFIQSYYYTGWVSVESVALSTEKTYDIWNKYAKLLNMSENAASGIDFAIVTDSQLNINGMKFDMGTALVMSKDQSVAKPDSYRVELPQRMSDGTLSVGEFDISVSSACIGYAEYNLKNFYIQAFKYLGTPYGWGGMHDNVDCSSYVLSVFKTFGFVFPRNTSQQNKVVGKVTNVESFSLSEKVSVLSSENVPTVIYISGHAMIYLGNINNNHYIIHAPGGGAVCETSYNGLPSVIRICQVG